MIHMIQELFGQTLRDAGDHVTSLPKAEQDLNVADVCAHRSMATWVSG
jgi:hypothetical protein